MSMGIDKLHHLVMTKNCQRTSMILLELEHFFASNTPGGED